MTSLHIILAMILFAVLFPPLLVWGWNRALGLDFDGNPIEPESEPDEPQSE